MPPKHKHAAPSSRTARVLARLEAARPASDDLATWVARCPVCGGQLSVHQDEELDAVMLRCASGCVLDEILGAIGLWFTDLAMGLAKLTFYASPAKRGRSADGLWRWQPAAHQEGRDG